MEANPRTRHKPAPLTVQVMHAERQVLNRHRQVSNRAWLLGQNIRTKISSPATLLIAGGVGFAIGIIPKRKAAAVGSTKRRPGSTTTMYTRALKLIALARTLSGFFPSSTPASSVQSVVPREAPEAGYHSASVT